MFTLYYSPSCFFCQKVLRAAADMNIEFNLKDISVDAGLAEELINRGGKRQVPYLVDEFARIEMYESDDIITYLKGTQSK